MKLRITALFKSLIALLLVVLFFACKKKMSKDNPLPSERKEAVIVCNDNSSIISYEATSGTKLWETKLNGICKGAPVLYNKKVYVHTDNGWLYQINVIKGTIDKSLSTMFPSFTSMLVNNGRLYIAADKLYCYDTTFTAIWNYDGGTACTSSPQFDEDKIYVAVGDKVHCIDNTGNNVWQSAAVGAGIIKSSVKVSGEKVYFGADDKKIYAIKKLDGSPVWNYLTLDKVESSPLIYGGMCIVGSTDYHLYCIDTITGLLRWKYFTLERVNSSPNIHPSTNTVLVGSYDFNLYAIDHISGFLKWKYPAGSLIKSSPVVYEDRVFFTSYDKYIYCVDAKNGKLLWKQFINANSQGSPIVDDTKTGNYATDSGMSAF